MSFSSLLPPASSLHVMGKWRPAAQLFYIFIRLLHKEETLAAKSVGRTLTGSAWITCAPLGPGTGQHTVLDSSVGTTWGRQSLCKERGARPAKTADFQKTQVRKSFPEKGGSQLGRPPKVGLPQPSIAPSALFLAFAQTWGPSSLLPPPRTLGVRPAEPGRHPDWQMAYRGPCPHPFTKTLLRRGNETTQRLCGSLEEAAPQHHAPDHRWSPAPLSPSPSSLSSPFWPDKHQGRM